MHRTISLSMSVALAATILAALPAVAESATVVRGGDCAMPGFGEGGELIDPGRYGTVKKLVVNDNQALMTCKGSGITNDYGRTHEVAGFACAVIFPDGSWTLTDESVVKITGNGEALMKCSAPVEAAPLEAE